MQLVVWLTGYPAVNAWLLLLHFSLAVPVLANLCAACGVFFLFSELGLLPENLCADCQVIFIVAEPKMPSIEASSISEPSPPPSSLSGGTIEADGSDVPLQLNSNSS